MPCGIAGGVYDKNRALLGGGEVRKRERIRTMSPASEAIIGCVVVVIPYCVQRGRLGVDPLIAKLTLAG